MKYSRHNFLRGAPLMLSREEFRNYVEDYWYDSPADVRSFAVEDLDGAQVVDGKMTVRVHSFVDENLVQYFHSLENCYSAKIANRCSELVISLNTYGGAVTDGLEIVDMIHDWNKNRDTKISILGAGAVYSMGVPVMQAAFRRYSYPNAEYLVHPVSGFVCGTRQQIADRLKSIEHAENSIVSVITGRSGMSAENVRALISGDSFITAQEAMEKGLIDEIVDLHEPAAKDDSEILAGENKRAQELRGLEISLMEV